MQAVWQTEFENVAQQIDVHNSEVQMIDLQSSSISRQIILSTSELI